jgi:hypothetical protein
LRHIVACHHNSIGPIACGEILGEEFVECLHAGIPDQDARRAPAILDWLFDGVIVTDRLPVRTRYQ